MGETGGRLSGFKFSFVIFSWNCDLNASEDIYSLFPICSGWKQTDLDQNGQLHLWSFKGRTFIKVVISYYIMKIPNLDE